MSVSNPQNLKCAAFETITVELVMKPAAQAGTNYELHVRSRPAAALLKTVVGSVIDASNGVVDFLLTSADTGTDIGIGSFDYDIWRIDAGNETRLVYGELVVTGEQWK